MPVYKNISGKDLWLDRPDGPGFMVGPTGTFVGSLYYKRYTALENTDRDLIFLQLVSGNTGVYVPTYTNAQKLIPNKFKSYSKTLSANYSSTNRIVFTDASELGREAFYLKITASGADVTAQLNDDVEITVKSGSTETFESGSVVIVALGLKGSGATADILAGTAERPNGTVS